MKMLKPLALTILCTLIATHCNANVIEQTCRKTPNYAHCIQYLKANPGSSSADVTGLALIMVDLIKAKANTALGRIDQLIHGNPQASALSACADKYNAILQADVPTAIAALKQGNPKFAEEGANDAGLEAYHCENDFSGKSPITAENNAMRDVAAITAAIVKLLL